MKEKLMWNCLIGNFNFSVDHPYDPDDFSRCYKLLQTVPEWNNLVENWDKLTEMFEKNQRTGWQNSKKIGMYEFMQTLI